MSSMSKDGLEIVIKRSLFVFQTLGKTKGFSSVLAFDCIVWKIIDVVDSLQQCTF